MSILTTLLGKVCVLSMRLIWNLPKVYKWLLRTLIWNFKEFDWELIEIFRDMSLLCRFWPLFWARFAFYQCDWSEIYQKCINDYCAPWYEILKNSIENLLRYLEICRFYVDFNHSFGQGLRSINAINLIFERNLYFIIIHHPAKFH